MFKKNQFVALQTKVQMEVTLREIQKEIYAWLNKLKQMDQILKEGFTSINSEIFLCDKISKKMMQLGGSCSLI